MVNTTHLLGLIRIGTGGGKYEVGSNNLRRQRRWTGAIARYCRGDSGGIGARLTGAAGESQWRRGVVSAPNVSSKSKLMVCNLELLNGGGGTMCFVEVCVGG